MLRLAHGLTDAELSGIAALEQRVVAHDGGRLKLEWNRLRSRDGERAEDVLALDGERLIGFAGLYGPGPPRVEIAGMVDPAHRRDGIGAGLLERALELCRTRRTPEPLLIVPRGSAGGRALAARHGARLDHSEHALVLRDAPSDGPGDPALGLRPARADDVAAMLTILTDGFGFAPTDLALRLSEPHARTFVGERDGVVVATLRITRDEDMPRVYGFAVAAALRGRGIGRDLLGRACRELRADGAREIGLEVAVDNDRALGLYTSLGFAPLITEDYWAIPVTGAE